MIKTCTTCDVGTVLTPEGKEWSDRFDKTVDAYKGEHGNLDGWYVSQEFNQLQADYPAWNYKQRCPACRGTGVALTPGRWVRVYNALDRNTPALPSRLAISGRHRWEGWPAHGIFVRPAPGDAAGGPMQLDWAAMYNGWATWRWRGPAMPRFASHYSRLVSPWTPILAQSLRRSLLTSIIHPCIPGPPVDCDEWTMEAILDGRKPYGYFGIARKDLPALRERAEAVNVALDVDDIEDADVPMWMRLTWRASYGDVVVVNAASRRTYLELFGSTALNALTDDYYEVLPKGTPDDPGPAYEAVDAIESLRTMSPADYLGEGGFADLENEDPVITGLTLGYPVEVTAGLIAASPRPWGTPAELGSLPTSRRRWIH